MKCPICQIKLYKDYDDPKYEEYACCMCGSIFIKNKGRGHLPKKYHKLMELRDTMNELFIK